MTVPILERFAGNVIASRLVFPALHTREDGHKHRMEGIKKDEAIMQRHTHAKSCDVTMKRHGKVVVVKDTRR